MHIGHVIVETEPGKVPGIELGTVPVPAVEIPPIVLASSASSEAGQELQLLHLLLEMQRLLLVLLQSAEYELPLLKL